MMWDQSEDIENDRNKKPRGQLVPGFYLRYTKHKMSDLEESTQSVRCQNLKGLHKVVNRLMTTFLAGLNNGLGEFRNVNGIGIVLGL